MANNIIVDFSFKPFSLKVRTKWEQLNMTAPEGFVEILKTRTSPELDLWVCLVPGCLNAQAIVDCLNNECYSRSAPDFNDFREKGEKEILLKSESEANWKDWVTRFTLISQLEYVEAAIEVDKRSLVFQSRELCRQARDEWLDKLSDSELACFGFSREDDGEIVVPLPPSLRNLR